MSEKYTCPECGHKVGVTPKTQKWRKHTGLWGALCIMGGEEFDLKLKAVSAPSGVIRMSGGVDYDYDSFYDENLHISNARITSINWSQLIRIFCPLIVTRFDKYLVDRLLRRTVGKEDFEVSIVNGWYGLEVEGVRFGSSAARRVFERFNKLETRTERLRFVLELEYGHLLPEIEQAKEWEIRKVPVDSIDAFEGHMIRVDNATAEAYIKDSPDVVAICVPSGDRWRLLDGRHRFTAAKRRGDESVWILTPVESCREETETDEQIRLRTLGKLTDEEKRVLGLL